MKPFTFRVGVDVGGTFIDIVFIGSDGTVLTKKILSIPPYSSKGVNGVEEVLSENRLSSESIDEIVHGTTVVINAIVKKSGSKAGLITTRGFRDVLGMGRGMVTFGPGYVAANRIAEDLSIKKWWTEPEMVTRARQKGML